MLKKRDSLEPMAINGNRPAGCFLPVFGIKGFRPKGWFSLLMVLFFQTLQGQPGSIPEGFSPIFSGKDLSGWHISRTNHHGTVGNFFVEDGNLVMKQYPFGRGGILLTDKKYGDFELYLEFKGAAGTNGGIFLRSNESGSAYQIELSGDGDSRTGSLIGEMLQPTISAVATELQQVWIEDGWNSFRIRVVGEKPLMTLWINGVEMWTVQAKRNDLIADATEGMVALQLHWSQSLTPVPGGDCCDYSWKPGAAHYFRNIAVREIK